MEPLFSRPVMASYFASRNHPLPRGDEIEQEPAIAVRRRLWRSLLATMLQASGSALIGAGNRLAGEPPAEPATRPGTPA